MVTSKVFHSRLRTMQQLINQPKRANRHLAQVRRIAHRFLLQQGPIDLVIDLHGQPSAVHDAEHRARGRFATMLQELVDELPSLRQQTAKHNNLTGSTAIRMWAATAKFTNDFITPMAAVAGAVADEILSVMQDVPGLYRIIVNNGGDIALHGVSEEQFNIGLTDKPEFCSPRTLSGNVSIAAISGIKGVATSGWHGRSHSLGVADAVTVLAGSAATADAAATLIANEVNVRSEKVLRKPARDIFPDSDLGDRLVTTAVLPLNCSEINSALAAGSAYAESLVRAGTIVSAILRLQGEFAQIGSSTERIVKGDTSHYSTHRFIEFGNSDSKFRLME